MTDSTIGEILNSDEPTQETEAVAETPQAEVESTETAQARARDEKGRFAPKGENDAPPASQEGHIPVAALKDERNKRQALEAELNQLRQQYQAQAQPQPQVQGPPDRWEDPEGYDQWLIAQAANYAGQAARVEARQEFESQRIRSAADEAKAKHPDYVEKIGVFEQMAQLNPMLWQEMSRAPNPAEYAYNTARLQVEIMQHGGIEGMIEARMSARENAAIQGVQDRLPSSAPPTLSSERSVGARSGPAWSGPTPLSELLG